MERMCVYVCVSQKEKNVVFVRMRVCVRVFGIKEEAMSTESKCCTLATLSA